jgi:hypothetical protein
VGAFSYSKYGCGKNLILISAIRLPHAPSSW